MNAVFAIRISKLEKANGTKLQFKVKKSTFVMDIREQMLKNNVTTVKRTEKSTFILNMLYLKDRNSFVLIAKKL